MEFTVKSDLDLICPLSGHAEKNMIIMQIGDQVTPPLSRGILKQALRILDAIEVSETDKLLSHGTVSVPKGLVEVAQPVEKPKVKQENIDLIKECADDFVRVVENPVDGKGRPISGGITETLLKEFCQKWSGNFIDPVSTIHKIIVKFVPGVPREKISLWTSSKAQV